MKPELELQMKIWNSNMKRPCVILPVGLQCDVLQITVTTATTTRQLPVLRPSFSFSFTSIIKHRTWLLKKEKNTDWSRGSFCTVFFVACASKGDPREVRLKSDQNEKQLQTLASRRVGRYTTATRIVRTKCVCGGGLAFNNKTVKLISV